MRVTYNILLVDDDDWQADEVARHLATQRRIDVAIQRVRTRLEALELLDGPHDLDCALVDLELADARDTQIVRELVDAEPELPVVVVTAAHGPEIASEVLRLGAADFVTSDEASGPMLARSIVFAVERKQYERRLRALATTDELTGLANRRALPRAHASAAAQVERHGGWLAVAVFDLDRFKALNDVMGHHMGDQVLAAFARRLRRATRPNDTVARTGGDEFMLLAFDHSRLENAEGMVRRMHRAVTCAPVHEAARIVGLGVSVGVAITDNPFIDLEVLAQQADAAMYEAKRGSTGLAVVEVPYADGSAGCGPLHIDCAEPSALGGRV